MASQNCSTPNTIKKNQPVVFPDPDLDAFAGQLWQQGMAMDYAHLHNLPFHPDEIPVPAKVKNLFPKNF